VGSSLKWLLGGERCLIDIENMLLVGSTVRNSGKTTFCCAFIEEWKGECDIIGLKVTTLKEGRGVCHRGNSGCGACSSMKGNYEVVEEIGAGEICASSAKDTMRMKASGAKRVFWIKALQECVQTAFCEFLAEINIHNRCVIVCESNALSEFVNPGVMVLMDRADVGNLDGNRRRKESADLFLKRADYVCDMSVGGEIERVLSQIKIGHSFACV